MNDEREKLPEDPEEEPSRDSASSESEPHSYESASASSDEGSSTKSESTPPPSTPPPSTPPPATPPPVTPPPESSTPPPAQPAAAGDAQLATAGDRFLAALIDALLMGAVGIIPILGAIVALVYALTKDALPFLNGQSLGKKAMKIRVVKDDTGEPITNDYGAAIVRAISLMIPIFGIVDAFMVFSADRKRFGDKWAKTKVIKEKA